VDRPEPLIGEAAKKHRRHSAAKPQPKELDVGVEQHLTFAEIFSRVIDSRV
jgi:hypothetical protein